MSDLNDPRVFFAAERTLLAWNRTSLALMAFGFVIERFGLFANMISLRQKVNLQSVVSFWFGIGLIVLGSFASTISTARYRKVLPTLKPIEMLEGYRVNWGVLSTLAV